MRPRRVTATGGRGRSSSSSTEPLMTCSALFTSCATPERSRAIVAARLRTTRSSGVSAFGMSCRPATLLEDAADSAADGRQDALHRALHALLQVALVPRTQTGRHLVTILEVLHVGRASFHRPHVG